MSFDSHLNAVCSIQKQTEVQVAGGEKTKTWTDVATNVKCRLDQAGGQEMETAEGKVVKATHILFMNNTTVGERDYRIMIGLKKFNILSVGNAGGHGHHLELLLARIF